MSRGITKRGTMIRTFLLNSIPTHPSTVVALAADHFGLKRQGINRYMRALITEGHVVAEGQTKARTYHLAFKRIRDWTYALDKLREDTVWRTDIHPYFEGMPDSILDIWEYGFTEMLNNAIDHSEGTEVEVTILKTPISFILIIYDDGMGIFRKIKNAMGLEDERHAILELSKGKFTTDPDNHTGEGIFFSSRCFDQFNIRSGSVMFDHNERINDEHWIFEHDVDPSRKGTMVYLELQVDSDRKLESVFDDYASEANDYAFNKTVVPVNLLRHGKENLVSRSQAKRLMARIESFKTVVLDFHRINKIGQAFADEVFRVFVLRHPNVKVIPVRANINVRRMIRRARSVMIDRKA